MTDVFTPDVFVRSASGVEVVREEEQLERLIAVGFRQSELAGLTTKTVRTLQRFRREHYIADPETRMRVNDLHTIIAMLAADGTYDLRDVVAWTRSRNPHLAYERPLDVLQTDDGFNAVHAAAEVLLHPELLSARFGSTATRAKDVVSVDPNAPVRPPTAAVRETGTFPA